MIISENLKVAERLFHPLKLPVFFNFDMDESLNCCIQEIAIEGPKGSRILTRL